MIKEGHEIRLPRALVMSGKGKGKANLGPTPSLPEVDTQSPSSIEALMTDPTLFEELLLMDCKEEVTITLGSMYGFFEGLHTFSSGCRGNSLSL